MRSLSRRAALGLIAVCVFFALAIVTVGGVGISGVHSTERVSSAIVSDELATSVSTARVGRAMDRAQREGDELFLSHDAHQRSQLQRALYDVTIPQVDTELTTLNQLHADDGPVEKADLQRLGDQWNAVRALLQPGKPGGSQRVERLDATYAPLSAHIDGLLNREDVDAQAGQRQAATTSRSTTWLVVGAILLAVVASVGIGLVGVRRIRRAVEPEKEQIEFAETLQVTDTEREAHFLLKRHLERSIPGATATVLNRNNSANRIEAMTQLPANSALVETLKHAEPRACLAIRSARTHSRDCADRPLLDCQVCGECPARTSCTPFTVSGEVIGAVLVAATSNRTTIDEGRVRESVAQAAPVLANLRNLAIAELRAATDSLTGLPNKRTVADTMKRMLAHASRSLTPMSMLMIDLDHFKNVNDRLGHPVGDQALANVGAAIKANLRASDFGGRNGGEEFVVLLPDTSLEGARKTAEKIRTAIAEIELPGIDRPMTASVGIAAYPEHATTADNLERLADAALYTAKRAGRNRCEIAESSQDGTLR